VLARKAAKLDSSGNLSR